MVKVLRFGFDGGPWHFTATHARKLADIDVHRDCGEWCAAFTLSTPDLPLVFFGTEGFDHGYALVHDAGDLWHYMQCAAVIDSNSQDRTCCANSAGWGSCPWYYPDCFGQDPHGYCEDRKDTDTGKQLAAGCGANVHTLWEHLREINATKAEVDTCEGDAIREKRCAVCLEPQWCNDDTYLGGGYHRQSKTPRDWMERFVHSETARKDFMPGWLVQSRQCLWQRSQKEDFIQVSRLYNMHLKEKGIPGELKAIENEVNMYVGENDGGVSEAAMRSLVGIFYLEDFSDWGDKDRAIELAQKLRSFGKDIPVFSIRAEQPRSLRRWDPAIPTNLTAPPYNLKQIWPEE